MIRSVAIIYKQHSNDVKLAAEKVEAWLSSQRISVVAIEHKPDDIHPNFSYQSYMDIEKVKNADIVLVLGGDGTIVSVSRQLLGTGLPLVGINFGKVGFLAELGDSTWEQGLTKILKEEFCLEKRMSLRICLERNKEIIYQGEAVNDVVVTRGEVARLGLFHLSFDNSPFLTLRSDGIIASTPTGSTGYACSAGAPLLHPSLPVFVVAAICPFLSNFPPLVQGADTQLSLTIGESETNMFLTVDGQLSFSLLKGDTLHIQGNKERHVFAELGVTSYFERLLRSGFVVGSRVPL